jgi:predicted XRE-type DNA-binding protein
MNDRPACIEGSDNVFADLGLPNPDEALFKAELAYAISQTIRQRRLTQETAAQILGLDQPKISAITRGRLSGFSVERLLRCLTGLDQDVKVAVVPKSKERGRIEVEFHPTPTVVQLGITAPFLRRAFAGEAATVDWASRETDSEETPEEESDREYPKAA